MKHLSKYSLHQLIPATILLGGVGSILFGISPWIGSGLIILGMLTGLVSHYYSEVQNDFSKYFMELLFALHPSQKFQNL